MTLEEWQIAQFDKGLISPISFPQGRSDVTLLAYHFCRPENEERYFKRLVVALHQTYRHCGRLKTVLVTSSQTPLLWAWAKQFSFIEIQVEPALVPGDIWTMSFDCNSKLAVRFSTPYVLIAQNDGFPLRSGLDEFVGKWDFIGAPYIQNVAWKRVLSSALNFHPMNGGFSLRSHDFCVRVSALWNQKYHTLGRTHEASEDIFATEFLPKMVRAFRRQCHFPSVREALQFSYEKIDNRLPTFCPFGFHGAHSVPLLVRELFNGLQFTLLTGCVI